MIRSRFVKIVSHALILIPWFCLSIHARLVHVFFGDFGNFQPINFLSVRVEFDELFTCFWVDLGNLERINFIRE
jgi:hypothetical protein